MECHCLAAHELPHTSKLYAAFLTKFERVERFYAHSPDLEGARAAARDVKLDSEVRRGVCEILREQDAAFGSGSDVERNVERLAAGAVAVVTGQQVGLFGGPAYSFYKALTAIELAAELTKGGVAAVPVFWLASEDHDLAEINHCYWFSGGGLQQLELQPEVNAAGRSVGRVPLGSGVGPLVESATELLQGESRDWVGAAVHESYTPRETFATAFGKLMARLLGGRGLVILDPLDARVHRLAAPVFAQALERREELIGGLLARAKELEKAGYDAQVKVTARSTLLFFEVEGQRLALRQNGEQLAAGSAKLAEVELRAALETSPESFSANALLRPVVQDSLLPTAAYVGGPAEIAYLAQAQVIYKRLLGRMPAVLPRAGFTLVDAHVAKLLQRYGLTLREVMAGRQGVRRKMELASLPARLVQQFDQGEKELTALLRKLRAPLGRLDRTLEGALDTAERKMLYQFLKLRGKAGRAENHRTGVLDRHERTLVDALFPHRAPQERTHSLLPWLARNGPTLLDEMASRARGGVQHQVLFL
jgi:bacillithiol biosynthesis cysteine-adding enzyme BshC